MAPIVAGLDRCGSLRPRMRRGRDETRRAPKTADGGRQGAIGETLGLGLSSRGRDYFILLTRGQGEARSEMPGVNNLFFPAVVGRRWSVAGIARGCSMWMSDGKAEAVGHWLLGCVAWPFV